MWGSSQQQVQSVLVTVWQLATAQVFSWFQSMIYCQKPTRTQMLACKLDGNDDLLVSDYIDSVILCHMSVYLCREQLKK